MKIVRNDYDTQFILPFASSLDSDAKYRACHETFRPHPNSRQAEFFQCAVHREHKYHPGFGCYRIEGDDSDAFKTVAQKLGIAPPPNPYQLDGYEYARVYGEANTIYDNLEWLERLFSQGNTARLVWGCQLIKEDPEMSGYNYLCRASHPAHYNYYHVRGDNDEAETKEREEWTKRWLQFAPRLKKLGPVELLMVLSSPFVSGWMPPVDYGLAASDEKLADTLRRLSIPLRLYGTSTLADILAENGCLLALDVLASAQISMDTEAERDCTKNLHLQNVARSLVAGLKIPLKHPLYPLAYLCNKSYPLNTIAFSKPILRRVLYSAYRYQIELWERTDSLLSHKSVTQGCFDWIVPDPKTKPADDRADPRVSLAQLNMIASGKAGDLGKYSAKCNTNAVLSAVKSPIFSPVERMNILSWYSKKMFFCGYYADADKAPPSVVDMDAGLAREATSSKLVLESARYWKSRGLQLRFTNATKKDLARFVNKSLSAAQDESDGAQSDENRKESIATWLGWLRQSLEGGGNADSR